MLSPLRLHVDPVTMSPLPVDLDLIKEHCSNTGTTDLDDLIDVYLRGAIEWAEGQMKRTIFVRSHTWVLKDFPRDRFQEIRLPRGKTVSVQSIVYSQNGQTVTLTGSSSGSPGGTDYQEDLTGDDGGVLMPNRGSCWPSVDCDVPAPVKITFTAGYDPGEVPGEIVHALLFAVSDAIDIRGTDDLLDKSGPTLFHRNALISAYKLDRWY